MGDMSNLLHNATVDTLLERRSIRKFKSKPLGDDVIETLETVAQHAASSQFLNDWSAIRVTDPAAKKRLAEIGGQPYIRQPRHCCMCSYLTNTQCRNRFHKGRRYHFRHVYAEWQLPLLTGPERCRTGPACDGTAAYSLGLAA